MSETLTVPEHVVTDNVGLAVLKTVRAYGVDTIFGIPGTHNLELYRHLEELGMHAVTTRHEQGAGYAADGWSLQTGKPGVVITTSGPGVLNALSAAATAYCESRPMLIIAPGPARGGEFADIGTLHETKSTVDAAGAIVEWSRRAQTAAEAVEAVHDAFEMFTTGRPRPVYLELPLDLLEGASDVPDEQLQAREFTHAPLDEAQLAAAAEALNAAERPVILAGGGSLRAGAEALATLAETLDAPFVTTMNGKAGIPETHPLSVGSSLRLQAGHDLVNEADVLLVIGAKVGEAELWIGDLAPTGKIVRVDVLESRMQTNLSADIGVVGNSALVVPALIERLTPAKRDGDLRADATRKAVQQQAFEWAPAHMSLALAIAEAMPGDAIIGADSSQICYLGTANGIPMPTPGSYLYMAAYATLGYGLPASIGAKVAQPERPVVCIVGDGALMFSVQEFATAVEQNLDLVVVCVDNGGYAEIEQNEADRGIAPIGVRLAQPDWAALATAFGAIGERVSTAEELMPKVRTAIEAGGVRLLHVPMALFEGIDAE